MDMDRDTYIYIYIYIQQCITSMCSAYPLATGQYSTLLICRAIFYRVFISLFLYFIHVGGGGGGQLIIV